MIQSKFLPHLLLLSIFLLSTAMAGCIVPVPIADAEIEEPLVEASPIEATPIEEPLTEASPQAPEPEPAIEEETLPAEPTVQTDWVNTAFLEGDLYIRGNPAAPIRLVDYSDFL